MTYNHNFIPLCVKMENCGCCTFSLSLAAKEEDWFGYCTCLISSTNCGIFVVFLYEDYMLSMYRIHVQVDKVFLQHNQTYVHYKHQYLAPCIPPHLCVLVIIVQYWKDVFLSGAFRGIEKKIKSVPNLDLGRQGTQKNRANSINMLKMLMAKFVIYNILSLVR